MHCAFGFFHPEGFDPFDWLSFELMQFPSFYLLFLSYPKLIPISEAN
jgi:hypothetical protein